MAKTEKTQDSGDQKSAKSGIVSSKEMYATLFAEKYKQLTGKKLKGDPTVEAIGGRPELLKYFQRWEASEG